MAPVLVIENLTKKFHPKRRFFFLKNHETPFTAVDNISFHLKEGEILGILGSNGAGKTTTINMIRGLITPNHGTITIDGINVLASPQQARIHTGVCPQDDAIDELMNMVGLE